MLINQTHPSSVNGVLFPVIDLLSFNLVRGLDAPSEGVLGLERAVSRTQNFRLLGFA